MNVEDNVVDLATFRARRVLERRRHAFADRRIVAWYPLFGMGTGMVWGFAAPSAGNAARGVARAEI
ncbi:MAG: hypothetical protein KIT73_07000 [Burkholderiales bacterium]|nr:hypothetical protein [Burkholderiales bacterium]